MIGIAGTDSQAPSPERAADPTGGSKMRIASIVAGTLIGAGALGFGGAAMAAPHPTPTATPLQTALDHLKGGHLTVGLTPTAAKPGQAVQIAVTGCTAEPAKAVSNAFQDPAVLSGFASAPKPRLGGNATIRKDARPGEYKVTVECDKKTDQVTLTVLGNTTKAPTAKHGQTKVIPRGGAKTGDGSMAAGSVLPLVAAGLILVVGGAGVVGVRHLRAGARD